MGVANRDFDASQQKQEIKANVGLTPTGAIIPIGLIASPCNVLAAKVSAVGLSGSPTALLRIRRFIAGSGATVYNGGFTTLTMVATGTSGPQSVVTATLGSTALQLVAGDQLELVTGAANTAVDALAVSVIVQNVQDIRSYFGS